METDQPELHSIAVQFPSETRWLRIMLATAAILLGAGLVTPVITLEKFIIVENTFSVLSGVIELLHEGQYFLFAVLTGFSVLLPILKLGVLFRLTDRALETDVRLRRYLRLMHDYGKWSMLDVFVVAVLVVAVKLGAIADVQMRGGLYAFAGAILITMFVTARIVRLTDRIQSATERS